MKKILKSVHFLNPVICLESIIINQYIASMLTQKYSKTHGELYKNYTNI